MLVIFIWPVSTLLLCYKIFNLLFVGGNMDIDDIIRRSETVIGLLEEQRASLNQLKNKESKLPSYLGETEEQIEVQDKSNNASFETKDVEIAVSESEHHIYIEAWAKLPSGDRIYKFNQTIERKIFNKEKSNE